MSRDLLEERGGDDQVVHPVAASHTEHDADLTEPSPHDEDLPTRAELQREQDALARRDFGGINWGACCSGFLVALGLSVLLGGIAAGVAASIGVNVHWRHIDSAVTTGAAITLALAMLIGFFAGGYVGGRMTRFDGGRQGVGVWLIALVLVALGAVAAYTLGHPQRDVLDHLALPRWGMSSGQAHLAALGAGVVLALLLLLAAALGGTTGQRYHRRVDALVGYR